jgi:hypothetical protein
LKEDELDEDFSVEVPKQKIAGKTYGGGATVIVKAKTASQAIKMVAKRLGVDVNLLKTGKVVKEEVDLDEAFKKGDTVTVLKGPHKGDKHKIIHDFGDGTYNVAPIRVPKIKYRLGAVKAKASDLKKEEADLVEGKMSQLHQHIKDKKSAEEIAKIMKLDVKTIKSLMSSYESTDGDTMGENGKYMEMLAAACAVASENMDESAASDARRAMSRDKDFSRKDSADDDDDATDDDIKGASKNIIMQLRKAQSLSGNFKVEFGDGKKVKIPAKMAIAVQQKYNSLKRPADKEKFQAQIAKSYKDMLKVLKAGYQSEQKESVLDRIDRKIKENKDG